MTTLPRGWQSVINPRVRDSTPWPSVAERLDDDARVVHTYGGYRWTLMPYVEMSATAYPSPGEAARACP